ncbi:ABC transporter ATP-binding protein [Pseudacidovorax intermedius]|uniref:ABC transporter ATP-binding protein n=1 Tax=Pseudacidovorax intermedius TaxID=433924 RepID=A0A147H5K5_9BURK|nr:ATP-binding cassette domain-containing protein [Pseudacidovorax intermedius]KTT25250.1 ABC transporter ATP-binding protein [Pseudacidovorax intermedius]
MTVDALRLSGIHKSFDGFKALTDAHFAARWGEVHALLGENGAGKSSLMNIAAGLYAPEQGELLVDDNPVRLGGPRDAAALHIGMVHQHFKLVRPFTVAENILLGHPLAQAEGSHRRRMAQLEEQIRARAAELGFAIDPRARIDRLSIAEQQRVEILKVLLAGARILILDEPTAVLTDQEAERLLATVHALSRQGAAVALVTHKMSDVKTWADRVTVMRGGRTVATVDPKATPIEELVRLTVGQSVAASQAATTPAAGGAPLLTVRGLRLHANGRQALDGVDLTLHAGQIYGLAGVGGNGQGELAEALMGMADGLEGTVLLTGEAAPVQGRLPHFAAIPADRYGLALAGGLSVVENFGIGQVQAGRYGPAWRLDRTRMAADTREAVQAFDVQGVRHLNQKAALLSGGNAQKLVLAREFGRTPHLVLAHSPSRGLDVRAGAEVHARLRAARDAGAAVLLISEDLDEVLALADRVGVMARGRIVAEFDQPADRQAVGQAMVNHD